VSNSPFDPDPLFPWKLPRVPPQPPSPSLADLLKIQQIRSSLASEIRVQPKCPRIFVSYQHSSDQAYYNAFSKAFHDRYEAIYDNSLERQIDSDNPDYVIHRIRDKFITGTCCTIVLVGPIAFQRKYVDWEIKATLDKEHGLIGVQLPNLPVQPNNTVFVPGRLHTNIQTGYAIWTTWNRLVANPTTLKQHIATACARSKKLIVNPQETKKKNG
jgi:hypothetical protein